MDIKYILFCTLLIVAAANAKEKLAFWKGTPLNNMIEETRANCDNGLDSMACIKIKLLNFLDTIFKENNFKIGNDVEIRSNGYENLNSARGKGLLDNVEEYIQSHDVTFKLPLDNTEVTVSPRNLNEDQLNLNIKFSNDVTESRKSKLKKIAVPIMVFVLLKAMTLIPLALGVLGLKAWNSLQLGFLSFVVSVGLAIFQLCKKLAADHHHHHPHIAAHGPWDRRSLDDSNPTYEAQNIAYNAYA